jgi:hypothetical protein
MTIRRAFTAIVGTSLFFGAIGTIIGFALGKFNPGYNRSVFRKGGDPAFDPVAVGIGQGATQGIAGGVVIGVALVALWCWRDVRLQRLQGSASESLD